MCCKGTKNISFDNFFSLRSFFFTVKNGILPKNYRLFRLIIRQIVSFAALPHRFAAYVAFGLCGAPRRLPVPRFFTDLPPLFRAATKYFRLLRPALKSLFSVFFSVPPIPKKLIVERVFTGYRTSFYGLSGEFLRGIEGFFTRCKTGKKSCGRRCSAHEDAEVIHIQAFFPSRHHGQNSSVRD